jgi:hypothetical protein
MGERRRTSEGVEGERTRHEPDDVSGEPSGKRADADAPPEQQEYPPAKARLEDDDEKLASQSDDEPSLE